MEKAKKAVAELKIPHVRGQQCIVVRNKDDETIYVRNISKSLNKEYLTRKLTEYGIGHIEEITLMEDPQKAWLNGGFAFSEFPTSLEATTAFNNLQKPAVFLGIDHCEKVAFTKSTIESGAEVRAPVKSIFVDGLPLSWDEERVMEKFKSYGEIEEVRLARSMLRAKRKDFGFISFRTREAALAYIEGVNKHDLNDANNKVILKANLLKPRNRQQKEGSLMDGVHA